MEAKTIELDGKIYRLAYTNSALCALEDRVDMVTLAGMANRKINTFCRNMMWAALIAYQPETTLEEAGRLVDLYQQGYGGREGLMALITELQDRAGLVPHEEADKN